MAEERYTPERRCIACRQVFPQDTLIRVADTEEGLRLRTADVSGGRSCYICRDAVCVSRAFEKNCFAKSLRRSVSKEELAVLRKEIDTKL